MLSEAKDLLVEAWQRVRTCFVVPEETLVRTEILTLSVIVSLPV